MEMDEENPRGSKRKAEEPLPPVQAPKRIKALDQDVVNKIAAGEIIVAPVHALKELIENAVDAGSTSLEIIVKEGGLKLLQITDNGHGIDKDDLPILCERFTTSKLKAFEDLSSIGTYGFRGEALASISHIAHLTVTTKTADSSCAWRAQYADGKLVPAKPGQSAEPKPTAGRGGTQIKVEDLFYNVISRQRAFRSPSEEYAKILDVVGRYAIHCSGVAFSCRKQGESAAGISTPSNATTVDSVRQVYGGSVANELINIEVDNAKWGFKAIGKMTTANYHAKKTTLLLFINHRSVESTAMKKALEQVYAAFLPKGGRPFIYLSLEIEPQRVDVNVHPTKREVNFLNEDEIIEEICSELQSKLSSVDTSRTFTAQSLLPGANIPTTSVSDRSAKPTQKPSSASMRPYENNLVRTDPNARKITSMLGPSTSTDSTTGSSNRPVYLRSPRTRTDCHFNSVKQLRADVRDAIHNGLSEIFASLTYIGLIDPTRRIAAIQSGVKLYLVDYGLLANELFYQIGLADFQNFGTIQLEPPLDMTALLELGVKKEKEQEDLRQQSASQEGEGPESPPPWSSIPQTMTDHLLSKASMLTEYFNLDIQPYTSPSDPPADSSGPPPEAAILTSIPLLLKNYVPPLAKLPTFLLRLGPYVNWEDETQCFHMFLRELASFYVPIPVSSFPTPTPESASKAQQNPEPGSAASHSAEEPGMQEDQQTNPNPISNPTYNSESEADPDAAARKTLEHTLEHVLFPAFRSRLVATEGLLKAVIEVADLKGLYRVFERC